jgi:hypothetical protein
MPQSALPAEVSGMCSDESALAYSRRRSRVELADAPERAAGRGERDVQRRERARVLAAALGREAAGGREEQDGPRRFAPARGHRFERELGQVEPHLVAQGLREQQVAHEQERLGGAQEPRLGDFAFGAPERREVEDGEVGPLAEARGRLAEHARARSGRARGGASARSDGENSRPGGGDVEWHHGTLRIQSKKVRAQYRTNRRCKPFMSGC